MVHLTGLFGLRQDRMSLFIDFLPDKNWLVWLRLLFFRCLNVDRFNSFLLQKVLLTRHSLATHWVPQRPDWNLVRLCLKNLVCYLLTAQSSNRFAWLWLHACRIRFLCDLRLNIFHLGLLHLLNVLALLLITDHFNSFSIRINRCCLLL